MTSPESPRDPITIAEALTHVADREESAESAPVLDLASLPQSLLLALLSLFDKQAQDVAVYDTAELTPFYSHVILCTGLSGVQREVLAKTVREDLHQISVNLLSQEGTGESGWILMDYRDFLIHIQSPERRTYYNLDRLWDDLPSCAPEESAVKSAVEPR